MIDLNKIDSSKVYTLQETAALVGFHPNTLRRKVTNKDDPFILAVKPTRIGKEWVFTGRNIHVALGSVSVEQQGE